MFGIIEKSNLDLIGLSGLPTPVAHLGLAQGYSDQCMLRSSNNDSGAGANADSRLDMPFVATDSLSELVWSPQKGLSLKCADGSFSDKKPSVLWGAGPSNMLSGSSTDKTMNEENFMASPGALDMGCEVAGRQTSAGIPTSNARINGSSHELKTADDQVNEMKTVVEDFLLEKEDPRNNEEECTHEPGNLHVADVSGADRPKLDVAQNDPPSEEAIVRAGGVVDGKHTSETEIFLASKAHSGDECAAFDTKKKHVTSLAEGYEESPSFMENNWKNKMGTGPSGIRHWEKLESTAENDLLTLPNENICGRTKIVASESACEVEHNSWQGVEVLPRDKTLAVKQSSTNSIRRYRMKGKAKALSDGNINGRTSNEEDDSHESVESCNSAGLFSTGKRRGSFEQQLVVESKKVKRQIQEGPESSSFVKQDSSFMNWISNMIKGFSKSSEDQTSSVALMLANPNHGHQSPDQNLITCNRNQDPGHHTMGFRSIFQSLYCPRTKFQGSATLNNDHQTAGSKELRLDNKMCNINATPIACRMVTGNIYKRFPLLNQKFIGSTSGSRTSPAAQPKDLPIKSAASQAINRSNSDDNKNSCNLTTDKEKDGTSSNSSLGKCKMNSAENIDSELLSEGKTNHKFGYKSGPLASLWITRFTPKTSGPFLNQDVCNKSTGEDVDFSDGMRLKPQLLNHAGENHAEDPLHVENCGIGAEASIGFHKIKDHHGEKSICKLNPILPSLTLKNSEVMASIFARRLDALKHIIPSDVTDKAAHATMTCFFCGIKGHHLRDCSEVTHAELEDLLKNLSSYDGTEELPYVCIRCFQLNHWAVVCPNASLRVRDQAECGASLVSKCVHGKMQLNSRNQDNPKLIDGRDSRFHAAGAPSDCDRNDPRMEKDLNLNWNLNEANSFGPMNLNLNLLEKGTASSSRGNKLKEIAPPCSFSYEEISDVPEGIFHFVKRLRLSRTNIDKWMNSRMPNSHLDGFYLRLRLGKWEEGLGGTGYYVACITGGPSETSKKSKIAVNVGGIESLVESQYVSNHDFLEDELMAWWSAALRGGGKMPSEEDLRLKVKVKEMLGF